MSLGPAPRFEVYGSRFENIAMTRDADGVLVMRFHTNGGPLIWGALAHEELGYAFSEAGADRENKVVVLTATGDVWCDQADGPSFGFGTAADWDRCFYDGRRLLHNLLEIEVPVISAINGPVRIHPELPVMSDIVIASETTVFQDAPHFMSGLLPGDGPHVVWPHLIGPNRGRYFLMMGQELDAAESLKLGVVGEVVPAERLMPRAMEVARMIAGKPQLTRRYTRLALTQRYKRLLNEGLTLGMALTGMALTDFMETAAKGDA